MMKVQIFSFIAICLSLMLLAAPRAYAYCCECSDGSCSTAKKIIENMHAVSEPRMTGHIASEFSKQRQFEMDTFFKNKFIVALQRMVRQEVAVGKQQQQIQGSLMDADEQMDTQRLMQSMQVEAYKDYQPSEGICAYGTGVRALAASQSQARANSAALSGLSLARQMGQSGTAGQSGPDGDKQARWNQFTSTHCDPASNNGDSANAGKSGMGLACGSGAGDKKRIDRDISYDALIGEAKTRDINFIDSGATTDEEDVQAFLDHIFPPLSRQGNAAMMGTQETQETNLSMRSIAAKRGVAQNSFNTILGMKSAGKADQGSSSEYLGAIMKQLGLKDDEIFSVIGENPSYYAQLEILGKAMYQSPSFFTELYDKPANVERKAVILKGVELMLDRALYESETRQEILMSVWLASKNQKAFKNASAK